MQLDDEAAQAIFEEARAMISAAGFASDDERYEQLMAWARENASYLLAAGRPEGLWLESVFTEHERTSFDDEVFNDRYLQVLRKAAQAGSIDAIFRLACELDYDPETKMEAARLFAEAAEAGHAYAMWCHGLNLISGSDVERDPVLGVDFIQMAADKKFEGAIQFMSDSYASGTNGYPQDEAESAKWRKKLGDKDIIHY